MRVVLQDGSKDCGICSLLSIILYYGGNVSREYLREITGTSKNGVSLYQLLDASIQLGFDASGVKGSVEDLDSNQLPCIAHIVYQKRYQHFVVVYDIRPAKKELIIMDPAVGRKKVSFSEFQMLSTGYFLYLKPVKSLPVFHEKKNLCFFIRSFCLKYKIYFIFIFIFSLLCILLQFVTAFHFQYLFDYAYSSSNYDNLIFLSICLLIIYLVYQLIQYIKDFILVKISLLFDQELIFYVYRQLLLLPYLFFKNRTLGEVLERIKDVMYVKNFVLRTITSLFSHFFLVLLFLFLMFQIQATLSFILSGYFLLSFFLVLLFYKPKKKVQKKVLAKRDLVQSFLVEVFQNVDTVKGLHLEYDFLEQFQHKYQNSLDSSYHLSKWVFGEENIKQVLYYGMLVLLYGFGIYYMIYQDFLVVEFFVYQYLFQMVSNSFFEVLKYFFDSYQLPIAFSRVEELFYLFRDNFDEGSYYQLYTLQGDISFRHLSFSYGSRKLLDDFSFVISCGSKILLTGESGTGKSSLVKMLLRYIDIPYGFIKIGDIDINHYHLDLLRSRISYVTGGELLFSNTLYYNITLDRSVDMDKVESVVRMVLLDKVVERFSLRYQTMVEENGFNFSSGERQKILLARALLKNSDIYIFDEAFHQIDVEQEGKILKNIFTYLKDKTVIVISHRLGHFELYDGCYELKNGEIYEL